MQDITVQKVKLVDLQLHMCAQQELTVQPTLKLQRSVTLDIISQMKDKVLAFNAQQETTEMELTHLLIFHASLAIIVLQGLDIQQSILAQKGTIILLLEDHLQPSALHAQLVTIAIKRVNRLTQRKFLQATTQQ
jgi:hypothetical protein